MPMSLAPSCRLCIGYWLLTWMPWVDVQNSVEGIWGSEPKKFIYTTSKDDRKLSYHERGFPSSDVLTYQQLHLLCSSSELKGFFSQTDIAFTPKLRTVLIIGAEPKAFERIWRVDAYEQWILGSKGVCFSCSLGVRLQKGVGHHHPSSLGQHLLLARLTWRLVAQPAEFFTYCFLHNGRVGSDLKQPSLWQFRICHIESIYLQTRSNIVLLLSKEN